MVSRIVLDTNVLISAFGWRGSSFTILYRALEGRLRLLIYLPLIEELRRVLAYPKFGFSELDIARFLLTVAEGAEIVFSSRHLAIVAQDPADNRVLECALDGGAHFIISGDIHLKELKTFHNIPILSPAEFLEQFPN